ncbi:unnamed protein product [Blepharisma stoltei]|uniref:Casein kinase I n=1 Tax=Blepharisma stoltei TaxID=1481888 RepID=A0AAU9J374_9CILI|nr:unnamed protein product [Blepharisma stoltei]
MENNQLLDDRFQVSHVIGSGSFGEVRLGTDTITNKQVAIKISKTETHSSQILSEAKTLSILKNGKGIPKLFSQGSDEKSNYIVIELLGPSLYNHFSSCRRRFSLKTILILAYQMIQRIEFVHNKSIIHRDIKPANFLMGLGENINTLYLIDYGLSKKYRDPKSKKHIPYKEGRSLTGTARFASINTHMGIEISRRDDLESIGYLLSYFMIGKLPWQELDGKSKKEKYLKIMERKLTTSVGNLFAGYPEEFIRFMIYCKSLNFEEDPDYTYIKGLILTVASRERISLNGNIEWIDHHELSVSESEGKRKRKKTKKLEESPITPDVSYTEKILCDSTNDAKSEQLTEILEIYPTFKNPQMVLQQLLRLRKLSL